MPPKSHQPCRGSRGLAMKLLGGLRDRASLIARAGELVGAGLAAAVAAGDRGGAVGCAAGDFVELHLAGKAVVQADDGRAEMLQVGHDRDQRGFLPAMRGRGRSERAADLAVQRALGPEAASLIEEVGHLRRHPAKAGAGADNDGVVIGEVLNPGDRGGLIELVIGSLGDRFGHQLRHALDVDGRAGFACTFCDGIRHRLDVTVGGVIEHEYFGHDGFPFEFGLRCSRQKQSSCPGLSRASTSCFAAKAWMAGTTPGHDGEGASALRYAASTSTNSESSSAVIVSFASLRIAAPSRALTRTPLTSMLPAAGTR